MEKIIRIDDHSGLVLEGGGMRGVFTCGVLDSFMDAVKLVKSRIKNDAA